MAKFGEATHHAHMHAGIKAAIASPKTPAHLKSHLQNRLAKMPMVAGKDSIKPLAKSPMFGDSPMPFTDVMPKFAAGHLHSGSKKGPVVKNRKQAVAILLSEKKKAAQGKAEYKPKKSAFFGEM